MSNKKKVLDENQLIQYSEKVKNLSIPYDDLKGWYLHLGESEIKDLLFNFFKYQLSGIDETNYTSFKKETWERLKKWKKVKFIDKYQVNQTEVEDKEINEIEKMFPICSM